MNEPVKHKIAFIANTFRYKINSQSLVIDYDEKREHSIVLFNGVNVFSVPERCYTKSQADKILNQYLQSIQ